MDVERATTSHSLSHTHSSLTLSEVTHTHAGFACVCALEVFDAHALYIVVSADP